MLILDDAWFTLVRALVILLLDPEIILSKPALGPSIVLV